MDGPSYLADDVAAVWCEIMAKVHHTEIENMATPEFDAYCGAIARLRDAQRRISDEGAIIPDGKQNPIPHPALAIERASMDQLRRWGSRFT